MRKGEVKPKGPRAKPKAVAAAKCEEIILDTSESEEDFKQEVSIPWVAQAVSRPQCSRPAASKEKYAVDILSDSDEDFLIDSEAEVNNDGADESSDSE